MRIGEILRFWIGGRPLAAAVPPRRDPRIDVIRGLALLMIFINHIPGNDVSHAMLHVVALNDAADIFVFLAGLSAMLAFAPVFADQGPLFGTLKVLARVWQLYVGHIVLFFVVSGVIAWAVWAFDNPLYIEYVNILPLFDQAATAIGLALTLTYQPFYLDILPLYIVLMACFPLLLLVLRVSPALLLVASLLLWAIALRQGWNLPNRPGAGGWFFNPFAWQGHFVLGLLAGYAIRQGASLPRHWPVRLLALLIVLGGFLLKSPWSDAWGVPGIPPWPEAWRVEADKTFLSPLRTLNMLAILYLIWAFVPADARWLERRPATWLALAGRHSLEVFCLGVVASVLGYIAITESRAGLLSHFIVSAIGCIVLTGLGSYLSWYRQMETALRKRQASPAGRKEEG